MKQHNKQKATETIGVVANQGFNIKASAKAFTILSSGLYTRKIEAFVRELACNARDAHVDAGNSHIPIDIKLPNKMSPNFYIRDYGTGLSEDLIMSLYTTYFESTKADSNDFIGAMGLGSKSPFSYVDTFVVTSFYDGVQYDYVCFIDETGLPNITKASEVETNQPNGLKIAISIQPSDVEEVLSATIRVFSFFGFPVNFVDSQFQDRLDGAIENYQENFRNHLFTGYSNSRALPDNSNKFYALMGGVLYPLILQNTSNISKDILKSMSDAFKGFVVINFDLGECDVAASREELQYDKETIASIEKKLVEIREDASKNYSHLLTQINTPAKFAIVNRHCVNGRYSYEGSKLFKNDIELPDIIHMTDIKGYVRWLKFKVSEKSSKIIRDMIISNLVIRYKNYGHVMANMDSLTAQIESLDVFIGYKSNTNDGLTASNKLSYEEIIISPEDFMKVMDQNTEAKSIERTGYGLPLSLINYKANTPKSNHCFQNSVLNGFSRLLQNDTDLKMGGKAKNIARAYYFENKGTGTLFQVPQYLLSDFFVGDEANIPKMSSIDVKILDKYKSVSAPKVKKDPELVHGFKIDLTEKKYGSHYYVTDIFGGKKDNALTKEEIDGDGIYVAISGNMPIIGGIEMNWVESFLALKCVLLSEGYKTLYFYHSHRSKSAEKLLKNKKHIDEVLPECINKFIAKKSFIYNDLRAVAFEKLEFMTQVSHKEKNEFLTAIVEDCEVFKETHNYLSKFTNATEQIKLDYLARVAKLYDIDADFAFKDIEAEKTKLKLAIANDLSSMDPLLLKLISNSNIDHEHLSEINRRIK